MQLKYMNQVLPILQPHHSTQTKSVLFFFYYYFICKLVFILIYAAQSYLIAGRLLSL